MILHIPQNTLKLREISKQNLWPDVDATLGPDIESIIQILDQFLTLQHIDIHTCIQFYIYIYIVDQILTLQHNFGCFMILFVQKCYHFRLMMEPFWNQKTCCPPVRHGFSDTTCVWKKNDFEEHRFQEWGAYVAQHKHPILERNHAGHFWMQLFLSVLPLIRFTPKSAKPLFLFCFLCFRRFMCGTPPNDHQYVCVPQQDI